MPTFSPGDASLNNATGQQPANWFGGFGATAADLLLQTFGIAALVFLAPPAIWGALWAVLAMSVPCGGPPLGHSAKKP